MTNREKYIHVFCESFLIEKNEGIENIEYQSVDEWDSIGHLNLIANLEQAFGISMEMDDITDLSSFKKGIEIISKYHVEF
jgi:acyl carrier protein